MKESHKNNRERYLSKQVYSFPYNGIKDNDKIYLSERILIPTYCGELKRDLSDKSKQIIAKMVFAYILVTSVIPIPISHSYSNKSNETNSVHILVKKTEDKISINENSFKDSPLSVRGGDWVHDAAHLLFDIAIIIIFCKQNADSYTFIPKANRPKAPDLSERNRYQPSKRNPYRKRPGKTTMASAKIVVEEEDNNNNKIKIDRRLATDIWNEKAPTVKFKRKDSDVEFKIPGFEAAKKLYHAPELTRALNPTNFGWTMKDLELLDDLGLVAYMEGVRKGLYKEIPTEYVQKFQETIKNAALLTDADGNYFFTPTKDIIDERDRDGKSKPFIDADGKEIIPTFHGSKSKILLKPLNDVTNRRLTMVFTLSGKFRDIYGITKSASHGLYDTKNLGRGGKN